MAASEKERKSACRRKRSTVHVECFIEINPTLRTIFLIFQMSFFFFCKFTLNPESLKNVPWKLNNSFKRSLPSSLGSPSLSLVDWLVSLFSLTQPVLLFTALLRRAINATAALPCSPRLPHSDRCFDKSRIRSNLGLWGRTVWPAMRSAHLECGRAHLRGTRPRRNGSLFVRRRSLTQWPFAATLTG